MIEFGKENVDGDRSVWIGIQKGCWALPLEISWYRSEAFKSFSVIFLCFGLHIERWNWDKFTGWETVKEGLNLDAS